MKRFGLMYGNAKRRKKVETFTSDFERNSAARAYTQIGFRVRKFERKAAEKKAGWL